MKVKQLDKANPPPPDQKDNLSGLPIDKEINTIEEVKVEANDNLKTVQKPKLNLKLKQKSANLNSKQQSQIKQTTSENKRQANKVYNSSNWPGALLNIPFAHPINSNNSPAIDSDLGGSVVMFNQ